MSILTKCLTDTLPPPLPKYGTEIQKAQVLFHMERSTALWQQWSAVSLFAGHHTLHKNLRILNILNFFVYFIYAMRARIAYINYTKQLRIFNILNFSCVLYVCKMSSARRISVKPAEKRPFRAVAQGGESQWPCSQMTPTEHMFRIPPIAWHKSSELKQRSNRIHFSKSPVSFMNLPRKRDWRNTPKYFFGIIYIISGWAN